MDFSQAKAKFDEEYSSKDTLYKSFVTVDGKFIENIKIKDVKNNPNEEYFKWQFIFALINSEKLPSRDYIGAEIYFPKGNINSAPIKIDSVIFKSIEWIDYYKAYRENKDVDALQKLRELAIGVIEYKRNDKTIEQVFSSQVKAAIKEPDSDFVLGIYYDTGRLFLFKKLDNEITRFDNTKSFPTSQRILERFQLEITDPYYMIPSLDDMVKILSQGRTRTKNKLKLEDLDTVYTIHDENIKNALNNILRVLDSVSLYNEEGYMHLIQLIAMKIYDEKQRETYGGYLKFYVDEEETYKGSLNDENIQKFVSRMKELYNEAKSYYNNILNENRIYWTQEKHVIIAMEIVKQFQSYSFIKSRKSDLYQLVF